MELNRKLLTEFYDALDDRSRETLDLAVEKMIQSKKRTEKLSLLPAVAPISMKGVTTLIAELIDKGLIDGVTKFRMLSPMKWRSARW